MIDLPRDPLVTASAVVEPLDPATIADLVGSEGDPRRRRPDWHPDFPREDDRDGVGTVTDPTGWTARLVRRAADGLVVGTIGFFGPPEDAADGVPEVEVGYGLVREARGRGLMGEVLGALLALTDAAGVRVRAGTEAGNAASLALLRRAGFVVRSEDPADPEREVVLVRELSA